MIRKNMAIGVHLSILILSDAFIHYTGGSSIEPVEPFEFVAPTPPEPPGTTFKN